MDDLLQYYVGTLVWIIAQLPQFIRNSAPFACICIFLTEKIYIPYIITSKRRKD